MANKGHKKSNLVKDIDLKSDSVHKLSSHDSIGHSEDIETGMKVSQGLSLQSENQYSVSAAYSDDFESETKESPRPLKKSGTYESYNADYTDDFESDTRISQLLRNGTQGTASYDYSDEFETSTKLSPRQQREYSTYHSVSSDISDDFETDKKRSPRLRGRYSTQRSVSFDNAETDTRISPRRERRYSTLHSVSSDYSDFETDTRLSPRHQRKYSTQRSVSVDYSDDFESDSKISPRHCKKSGPQHSVTFEYTEDFESDTCITPRSTAKHRTVSFQYSEDFESDDDVSLTASKTQKTLMSSESSLDSEEEEAKAEFVKSLLKHLKRPKPSPRRSLSKPKAQDTETDERINKFCQEKIQALRSEGGKKQDRAASDSCRLAMRGLSPDMDVCEHGISPTAIAHLKIQNTLSNLHKAANTKIHEPFKCPHCRDKMANVAAEDFIRQKTAVALKHLVEEKMLTFNQHCNDPVYLMGEIVKDLPNINANPHVITQKLLKPLEEHKQYIVPQHDNTAETGNAFWKTFFSRLKEHPGREYMNLYENS